MLEGWNAALADERSALVVLLHGRTGEPPGVLKTARHAVRPRLRRSAVKLLKFGFRHIEIRADDVPENKTLECRVVGADGVHILDGILDRLWERLIRRPEFDLAVVDRPRHTEHLRGRVLRVGVGAVTDEVAL